MPDGRQPSVEAQEAAERIALGGIIGPESGDLRTRIALALDDARTDERERVLGVLDEALIELADARTAHEVRGYVKAHL